MKNLGQFQDPLVSSRQMYMDGELLSFENQQGWPLKYFIWLANPSPSLARKPRWIISRGNLKRGFWEDGNHHECVGERESAQLGKCLAEMLYHSVKYRFEFIQNANFVSKVEMPFYTPTSMCKTFSCSVVLPKPCIFINVSNSNVCIVVSRFGSIYIFLYDNPMYLSMN